MSLPEEVEHKLESIILDLMIKHKVPGLSIAMVRDEELLYARGFGSRDLEKGLPATPDTLYGIGSITKSFTALAIMQLVEKGKIDLDDQVDRYVPVRIRPRGAPIRIRHLLTHTSGLPSLCSAEAILSRLVERPSPLVPLETFEDLYTFINNAEDEVVTTPGERFFYFNAGYTLLGKVIEKVSGMVYEEYIEKLILRPLEMYRSTFLKEQAERDRDILTAYKLKEGRPIPVPFPFHPLINPAGGLLSSVRELVNYLIMNIHNGVYKENKIINGYLLKEMHEVHVRLPIRGWFGDEGYGYGWHIYTDFHGHKLIGHGGNIAVSSAYVGFIPDLRLGVAVATNCGHAPIAYIVALTAIALLIGKDPEKDVPHLVYDRILEKLAGVYESYKGIVKAHVVRRGSILMLEFKEPWPEVVPLIPADPRRIEDLRFYSLHSGFIREVEFVIDERGEVDLYFERYRLHRVGPLPS